MQKIWSNIYSRSMLATNQGLPNLVRNYVHYDNLTSDYTKQASAARKMKDEYESKIIHTMQSQNMINANIQISGAALNVVEDKVVPTLCMSNLESYLHAYFSKKGSNFDETDAIIGFIKQQKIGGTRTGLKLKKTVSVPRPVGS